MSNNSGSNNNTNNRILLVDDEADITTVYTLGLQDNGFKVDAFNDPKHYQISKMVPMTSHF